MEKLQDSDVYYAKSSLDTMIRHAKSIISDGMVEKEVLHPSSASALNIIGAIVVFTRLEKSSKLAMKLTSKPYSNEHWNY
jgi:hypothetical protein